MQLKFSPPGAAPVELSVAEDGDDVAITVADHGEGIPEDQTRHIFTRFHQVRSGRSKLKPGVGIGLALVKDIVDAHHGTIAVESEVGKGTRMCVRLPRGNVAGAARAPAGKDLGLCPDAPAGFRASAPAVDDDCDAGPVGAPRILVCEDDDDLRAHLREVLCRTYRVASAANGADGLRKAREALPELVLTDIMMPEMSGTELLEAIHKDERLATVPCVFLTALTGDEVRLEALRSGVADFVQKPFGEEELLARIGNLLRVHALARSLDQRVRSQTAELRSMAFNLTAVQEGERLRIAREIHDESGQVLTGLRMEIERLRHAATRADRAPTDELERGFARAEELLAATHSSVDRMINALRPSVLASRGFVSAITWLAQEARHRHHVDCSVEIGIDEEDLSSAQAVAFYRIVQEALTNIERHSRATRVTVGLDRRDGALVLDVSDNGSGFDPDVARDSCFGLLGIRERARLLGGTCVIDSRPGEGTRIRVSVPIGEEGGGSA